jgi:hypothetical protein
MLGRSSPPGRTRVTSSVKMPSRGSLRTGTDSPVSRDSSACRSLHERSTASAGTRSPSATSTMSPRATSLPGTYICRPSRITRARGLDRSRKASRARSVLRSWKTVMPMTTNTKPSSMKASWRSPRTAYRAPANTSRRNMGSRATPSAMAKNPRLELDGSSL